MIRKKKFLKGGVLLSAILLTAGDLGSTVSWAAQLPPGVEQSVQQELPDAGTSEVTPDQMQGQWNTITGGDAEKPVLPETEAVTYQIPTAGIVWSSNLGNAAANGGNTAKWWKDGKVPADFVECWLSPAHADGKFQLSMETEGGVPVVHCQSQDAAGRYDMLNSKITGIDYSKNYILSAYVKLQNVSGGGFTMRAQAGENVNVNLGENKLADKSKDGWQLYEIELKDIADIAQDNSGKLKIELFFQYFTGDIWVKDIVLKEQYHFNMDRTVEKINVGDHVTLSVETDIPSVSMGDVVWTSSDAAVATVSGGDVTGVKGGNATITASLEELSTNCRVYVNDPAMSEAYGKMREKWTDRLTGNSYWNEGNASDEYKTVVKGYEEAAAAALAEFSDQEGQKLFNDLDLTLKEGSSSTNSNDSADLSTAISRIQDMARVWACEGSRYYHEEELKNKILYALDWVHTNIYHENLDNQARYGNWYHWWISMPQNLAGAAILMYDELSRPENMELLEGINATLTHFNEDPGYVYKVKGAAGKMDMTGANLADTCLVSVLRSALAQDQEGVVLANGNFNKMVQKVTSGEGIYEDGSFIQHTNLAYTGGYGATLLNGTEKIIYLTTDSNWEIEAGQLDVIFNWIWDGIRPLYADGAVFDMVSGRSVARPNRSDLTTGRGILAGVVLMAKSAPEEMQSRIQAFAKKHLIAGAEAMGDEYYSGMNAAAMMEALSIVRDDSITADDGSPYAKVFGGMDKAVAHSGAFSAGFSLASGRTGRFEYGNQENSMGWHQGDGMLYLYNGDSAQYSDNYWNTIDPQRLPGITTDQSKWDLKDWGNYPGNANYNGGAALDRYAAIAMNFKNYSAATNPDLTAKKVWFVFDDEILCMGAGISGIAKDRDTETIVENKKVNGSNQLLINGTAYSSDLNTDSMEQKVSWAWLEGNTSEDAVGYYFPSGNDVYVKRESRTGSYRDVNNGNTAVDNTPVTRNYVSLSLKHGEYTNAVTSSYKYEDYDYVLLPGKTADEVKNYSENPDIEILANNAYVQAAHDKSADVYSYVFWQPSASSNKALRVGDVESDYATIVMERNSEDKTITLGIADPLQNRDKVTVRLYGNNLKLISVDNAVTVTNTDKYGVVLDVATKGSKGATFKAVFSYEEQSAETMAQYQKIRDTYAENLTGNSFEDKTDAEYKNVMNNYTKNARAVWETLITDADRTRLWEDLDITLDYTKEISNENSVPFDTTTDRIRTMTLAYASEGSELYKDEKLGRDIKSALEFVLDHYPTELADKVYGNWWHWDIGIAQDLCDITLLMYQDLDEEMINRVYYHLDKTVPFANYCWMRGTRPYLYTTTAANTMDIGVVRALTGAIGNDFKGLYMASDALPTLMKYVTKGDGFYADGSYVQHGTLAYTGGYGADAIRGVTKIASLTNGTPWACTEVDPNIVYEWILNGFRPLYADGGVFEMVTGRQISRYNRNDITTGRYIMDAVLTLAESAPDQYRDKILSFAKTQVAAGVAFDKDAYYGKLRFSSLIEAKKLLADSSIPFDKEVYTKIFGQMDKAVVHGSDYSLGISMYSSRTGNVECGNNENYKGWFTSDGMTYLYNGDQKQYNDNYWPTVDMTRLAGITTNHVTGELKNFSDHLSPNSWVGGSSVDNKYASIGMDFTAQFPADGKANLTAKKSWFALGDQIVALGAGITSKDGDFTETIVENRKIDNDNRLLADGNEVVAAEGDKATKEINWAWLSANQEGDAIGYYFPEGSQVVMQRTDCTGKWQDINNSSNMLNEETSIDITRRYVTLAIDHGKTPENAVYSYVLLPGKTDQEMAAYAENNGIQILSNTSQLQAVQDVELGVAGYNFWEAGSYQAEQESKAYSVEARQPISMTIAEENGVFTFGIADPTQKSGEVTVAVELDTENLTIVSLDEAVTVNMDTEGKLILAVQTQEAYGATFTAVLADKVVAEALKLLDNVEKTLAEALTTEDLEKVTELQSALEGIDTTGLSKADQERAIKLSAKLAAVIDDIKAVMNTMAELETVVTVDESNADAVTALLAAFDNLTDAQKALLTKAQQQTVESVRVLWQAYQDSLDNKDDDDKDDDNKDDGDKDDDNKPEEMTSGENAQQAVSAVIKELEQAAETIKQMNHSGNTVEAAEAVKNLLSKLMNGAVMWKQVVEDIRLGNPGAVNGKKAISDLETVERLITEIFSTQTKLEIQESVPSGFKVINALLNVPYGENAILTVQKVQKEKSFKLPTGSMLTNVAAYSLELSTEGGSSQSLLTPVVIRIPVHEGLDLTADKLVVLHYYGAGNTEYEELPVLAIGKDYVETVTTGFSTFVLANKTEDVNGGDNNQETTPETQVDNSDRKSPKTYDDSPFLSEENKEVQSQDAEFDGVLAAQTAPNGNGSWAAILILVVMLIAGTGVSIYWKKREEK